MSSIAKLFSTHIIPSVNPGSVKFLTEVRDMTTANGANTDKFIEQVKDTPLSVNVSKGSNQVVVCFGDHPGRSYVFSSGIEAELSVMADNGFLKDYLVKRFSRGIEGPVTFKEVMVAYELTSSQLTNFLKGKKEHLTSNHLMFFMRILHEMYMEGSVNNADRQRYFDRVVREFS